MEQKTTKVDDRPIPRIKAHVNQCGLIVECALGAGDWITVESRSFVKGEQPCYAVDNYFKLLDQRGVDYYRVRED